MIFKQTWINVADNTNVNWLQTFHLYKGFFKKSSKKSFFIKTSAQIVESKYFLKKAIKFRISKKGDVLRALIVRTAYNYTNLNLIKINFFNNEGIIIKKQQLIRSKYLLGPLNLNFKRKKIITLYKSLL